MQESLPLPDQIDQAITYIKNLEGRVKMAQQKKESLMGKGNKRSLAIASGSSSSYNVGEAKGISQIRSPHIEIREMGSSLEIVLITGLDNNFVFYEIIRILHEENIEVVAANSSRVGDSMHQVVHAEVPSYLYYIYIYVIYFLPFTFFFNVIFRYLVLFEGLNCFN